MANDQRRLSKYTGVLKWLDPEGFGYIVNGEFEDFVMPYSLTSDTIKEGDTVSYFVTKGSSGRYQAINVQKTGFECYRCKRTGHLFHDCPNFVGYFWIKCLKCGFIGHSADDCDQKFFGFSIDKTRDYNRLIVRSCNCRYGCWVSLFGGPCTKFGKKVKSNNVNLGSSPFGFNWPHLTNGLLSSQQRADRTREKRPKQSHVKPIDDCDDDDELGYVVCVKEVEKVKKVEEVEECFILDFDPYELPNLQNLTIFDSSQGGNDDEDLLILAQKGKVACRDYAHPRHLCATYSFKETPHASHCDMCYCYVCEVPAPCKSWITVSLHRSNHCDASADILYWRLKRVATKNKS